MQRYDLKEGKSWILQTAKLPAEVQLSDDEFKELWNAHPPARGTIALAGKAIDTPRWHQSYGLPYLFSGVLHAAVPIPPLLQRIKKWVEKASVAQYDQILVNWYEGGKDYIGFHSDDERQLVPGTPIYSFTYCEDKGVRDFVIKNKKTTDTELTLKMPHNSMLVMGGETQTYYKHGVPKRLRQTGKRINVTLRQFKA